MNHKTANNYFEHATVAHHNLIVSFYFDARLFASQMATQQHSVMHVMAHKHSVLFFFFFHSKQNYCRIIEACIIVSRRHLCVSFPFRVNSFTQNSFKLKLAAHIQDFVHRFCAKTVGTLCRQWNHSMKWNMQLKQWHNCNERTSKNEMCLWIVCQCNCKMWSEDTLATSISRINWEQFKWNKQTTK